MKLEELMKRLDIHEEHLERKHSEVPVVEPGIYNLLGKQLFELYQKYEVDPTDQRRIESLCYFLQCFTLERPKNTRRPFFERLKRVVSS